MGCNEEPVQPKKKRERIISAAASTAGRNQKKSMHSLGKKKLDTELKFSRWDRGTQDLLGQEPCSSEPRHFYLVSRQAESICCATMKSASCAHGHVSHFIDYFKLSSRTRAIT